jgi:trehalose 6-phosphate phosphatase
MQQSNFSGRVPVAIGDDVTDEDAFVAAASLGGFGIAVGPRPSNAARFRMADTHAVNAWLASLAAGDATTTAVDRV